MRHVDCLDTRPSTAMLSDDKIATMCDRRGVNRNTDIGGWNHRWDVLQCYCSGYDDAIRLLDMPIVCSKDESYYVLFLITFVRHGEIANGL